MKMTIDGRSIEVEAGATIMEACAAAGIAVPSLCNLKGVASNASCGVCVVEVAGAKSLVRSCVQFAAEGMTVSTNSRRVMEARRTIVELLLANHPSDCTSCLRSGSCELQALAERLGVRRNPYPRTRKVLPADAAGAAIVRDNDKCVLCGRCVEVCRETQGVSAIDFAGRGIRTRVAPFMDRALGQSACVSCGQCTLVCPTGALTERDETEEVFAALADPELTVVVQTAPAIRASLGEALGMSAGSLVTGKMAAALRRLGFSRVFDTQFTADLTIMEEGSELLRRLSSGGALPMITSCSPGWINFIETFYPALLPHLSTCKSPQQMFGAIMKTYYAQKHNIDPANIVSVSLMPCTAKKFEADRPEMTDSEFKDVDYVLTTRELARMIKETGLDLVNLPESEFDDPLGTGSGAGQIFGATGGVMEAAIRTAYELVTGEEVPFEMLRVTPVRGMEGVKTAELPITKAVPDWKFLEGATLKVMVGHGLINARWVLDQMKEGRLSDYHFVEIMCCPGGCLGGGGQPIPTTPEIREARAKAIYEEDENMPLRKSHLNPVVAKIYEEFLTEGPCGHKSHKLLHTKYTERGTKLV